MALKIYGIPRSRAMRTIWMAEELDLDYEIVRIAPAEAATSEELAAAHPSRQIPVIDDDGLVLWESMAINLHLARSRGGALAPADIAEDGHALSWSFYAATEIEPSASEVLFHGVLYPPETREPARIDEAMERLRKPLGVIDGQLGRQAHLIADRFTVADLNVASVLLFLAFAKIDLSGYPALDTWLRRCLDRPAARKASALRES